MRSWTRAHARAVLAGLTRVLVIATGVAPPVCAQSPWDAQLAIDPYPSPYLSDWEANPTISSLTITNPTGADQPVSLVYRVTNAAGLELASGRSDPQTLPPGATVFTSFVDISGSSAHDAGIENEMRRTGRLPEGTYSACVVATDAGGFVLAEACADFSVLYPDPPLLLAPLDDEATTSPYPVFQWTPLQVPASYRVLFDLRVVEVLANQTPDDALRSNIPVYENYDVGTTNFAYPIGARALEPGKTYAWRVLTLDQNGYPPAANGGMSEIRTFRVEGPGITAATPTGSMVSFTVANYSSAADSSPGDSITPLSADTLGLTEICRNWSTTDSVHQVQLGVNSPVGFPRKLNLQGRLDRLQLASGSRVWALSGTLVRAHGPPLSVLAYGDCDGPVGTMPWTRWIGVRTAAGAASSAWLMGQNDTIQDSVGRTPGLEFGLVVFSAQELTVEAPAGFDVVNAFLAGHSIDVKPGVNLFGILQLEERPFWQFFQAMGYDQKELQLYGFVGVNTSLSVGFGITKAGAGSVDRSAEIEFLNLRAAFPARTPVTGIRSIIKSMYLELEIVGKDSAKAVVAGGDTSATHQLHFILNLNHHLILNDTLVQFLHMNPGAELICNTALDFGKEFNLRQGGSDPVETKLIRKYTLDASWPIGNSQFVIGHPEFEIDVTVGGENKGEISFTLSGAMGWGSEEQLGKLAVSIGRKATPPLLASLDADKRKIANWQDRLAFVQDTLQKATTAADSAKFQGYIAELNGWIAETTEQMEGFERLNTTKKLRERTTAETPRCLVLKGWYCLARLSLGNVSLVDLFSLMREAGFAAAQRSNP